MKKILLTLLALFLVFVISVFSYLCYHGLLTDVSITEKQTLSYTLVYQKHIGPYKDVGPIMQNVSQKLEKDHGLKDLCAFGIYFDNPALVDEAECRSIVGCILPTESTKQNELSKDLLVDKFPVTQAVIAEFPYKGFTSMMIGIFKVYPKLDEYITNNKKAYSPIFVVYDAQGEKIEYIVSQDLEMDHYLKYLK